MIKLISRNNDVFLTCLKAGEDKDYSVVSGVELKKLFSGKKVKLI